jgi:hypothetical protein
MTSIGKGQGASENGIYKKRPSVSVLFRMFWQNHRNHSSETNLQIRMLLDLFHKYLELPEGDRQQGRDSTNFEQTK